ncbi:MAG TPA: beta-galactosidase, partial [Acidobacteriota bacterium]|nr:beta-galactosidase [Acidobacteriota bacterium]
MKSSQIVLFLIVSLLVPIRAADDFFPFAVWYGGGKARAPMLEQVTESSREEWRKDLETIKELGFNTVRTWVEWTAGEPRENEYRFDNLTLLLELAEEVGLKVFIQVYVDSAPDWVGEKYPEARFVAQSGEVIPSQSAPGYCFDHPGVREKILDFYRQAARIAGEYPNFLGWDVWSEPHVINWAIIDFIPNATFCYCPSSQTRFRHWLQGRYGSLDQLNQAWYRTFTNWDQVEPPRFGTILSYTDFIDWRTFIQQKLAQDLAVRMKAVKEVVPDRVVTSHAAVPSLFTSPLWGVGAPDDWLMVENVDFWGTSIYPKHSFPDRHWSLLRLSVIADFIRSSGRHRGGFYIGELQAGTGIRGTVVGDPVTEEDHLLWVSKMLSRGAKAINVYAYYPMNSGYEAGGYGLINLDGT